MMCVRNDTQQLWRLIQEKLLFWSFLYFWFAFLFVFVQWALPSFILFHDGPDLVERQQIKIAKTTRFFCSSARTLSQTLPPPTLRICCEAKTVALIVGNILTRVVSSWTETWISGCLRSGRLNSCQKRKTTAGIHKVRLGFQTEVTPSFINDTRGRTLRTFRKPPWTRRFITVTPTDMSSPFCLCTQTEIRWRKLTYWLD